MPHYLAHILRHNSKYSTYTNSSQASFFGHEDARNIFNIAEKTDPPAVDLIFKESKLSSYGGMQ